MKRLVLAMVVLGISSIVRVASAQDVTIKNGQEPFVANFSRLSTYLDLSPYQVSKVYHINEQFIKQQKEALNDVQNTQEEKLQKVVLGNLKQMKEVLGKEQYRKYVTLLNVTNNNRQLPIKESNALFAENK